MYISLGISSVIPLKKICENKSQNACITKKSVINLLQIESAMSGHRLRIPHFHADGKQKGENYEGL